MGFNTMLYDGFLKKSSATSQDDFVAFSRDFTSHDPAEVSKVTFNFTKMSHVGNKWCFSVNLFHCTAITHRAQDFFKGYVPRAVGRSENPEAPAMIWWA